MRHASSLAAMLLAAVFGQAAHSITITPVPPPSPPACAVNPPTTTQTGPIAPTLDRSVWFVTESALAKIDPALNAVTQTIDLQGVKELAVDVRTGNVWATTQSTFYLLAPNGAVLQRLDAAALSLDAIKRLAVNPYDNSVWLASNNRLAHVSATGQFLFAFAIPAESKALSLAADETLWVISSSKLSHYLPAGQLLAERNLADFNLDEAKFLFVDSLGEIVWLAGESKAVALRIADLGMATSISFNHELEDFDVDSRTGTLYALSEKSLSAYSRAGALLWQLNAQTLGLHEIKGMRVDPRDGSVWLGADSKAVVLSAGGQLVATIPLGDEVKKIGVAPPMVMPTLTLIQPPLDALTNNPAPPISLQYGADCLGQPCLVSPLWLQRYTLTATLNGQSVSPSFVFDPANNWATYTPPTRLPECVNTLQAQAKDPLGHDSNAISTFFTIDTIPPTFTKLVPSGGVFYYPNVVIQGEVDDPKAMVVLENLSNWNGTGNNPSGQTFTYSLTLKPGMNTITIAATDPAGNVATRTLNLDYEPISIQLDTPLDGASVVGSTVLVSGSIRGPDNVGVRVNGVVASVYGNRFYAEIPIVKGLNAITVTAVTPEGAEATHTLSVTSQGPAQIELKAVPTKGLVPLPVQFSVTKDSAVGIRKIEFDFNGDGIKDFETTDATAPIKFTYALPGIYKASAKITDDQGIVHTLTQVIVANSVQGMDNLLQQVYSGMLTRLQVGDINSALTAVSGGVQEKYRAVFTALKPNLATIVDQLGTVQEGTIGNDMAEYVIVRNTPTGPQAFPIYFLLGEDGVWRIDGM